MKHFKLHVIAPIFIMFQVPPTFTPFMVEFFEIAAAIPATFSAETLVLLINTFSISLFIASQTTAAALSPSILPPSTVMLRTFEFIAIPARTPAHPPLEWTLTVFLPAFAGKDRIVHLVTFTGI